jgi:hypothetical protein
MAGFLFWNLYGRQQSNRERREREICAALTRLVLRHRIDVLVFSECEVEEPQLQLAFDAAGQGNYVCPPSRSRRIKIWTRYPPEAVIDRYNGRVSNRITIRELRLPGTDSILLVGVHLKDRRTIHTEEGRGLSTIEVREAIRRVEASTGHRRTILVGDLNMNPYEAGVVGTQALHAVMTRDLARSMEGLAARDRYPCFYNPMWSCFGDRSPGPSGTHYYPNADEPTNHFWHIYDQVLIRPDVLDRFTGVTILTGDGEESFVTPGGRPRAGVYSDHFPLYFEFDF